MKVLIAEDSLISRRVLQETLPKWGYEVVVTADGREAWGVLQAPGAPSLAILDWVMPGMDGIEVCRRVRGATQHAATYLILLTARDAREDLLVGLEAGADDYLTKPFDFEELRVRLQVGVRVVELQQRLAERVRELEQALSRVKQLQGLLPICAHCKKIRDDKNYWQQVETYIVQHSEATFTHGICPTCWDVVVKPQLEQLRQVQSPGGESRREPQR